VLDCSLDVLPSKWVPKTSEASNASNGFHPGDWMELSDRETYRLDVLIGERPGGQFKAILLVEEAGKKYEKDDKGNPIVAVFSTLPLNVKEMPPIPNAPKVDKQAVVMTPKRNVIAGGNSPNML
jgi:hypothetical protein